RPSTLLRQSTAPESLPSFLLSCLLLIEKQIIRPDYWRSILVSRGALSNSQFSLGGVSTLQATPHGIACKTRGQDGFAPLVSRRALSSPTTCRFIPALSGWPTNRPEWRQREQHFREFPSKPQNVPAQGTPLR